MPREKSSTGAFAVNALFGAALGILFTALFVASRQDAVRDLVQRPDAVLPVLCLMLNMCALFACAAFATSFALGERDQVRRTRGPGGGRALLPVAAASIRRCAGAGSA